MCVCTGMCFNLKFIIWNLLPASWTSLIKRLIRNTYLGYISIILLDIGQPTNVDAAKVKDTDSLVNRSNVTT